MTIEDKPACYKIELKKENEKGVALAGAEFTLYEDQACRKEIDRVLTDGNGIAMFENLEVKKKYYMKETKAPTGYRIPKTLDDADIVYEICPKVIRRREVSVGCEWKRIQKQRYCRQQDKY